MKPEDLWSTIEWAAGFCFRCEEFIEVTEAIETTVARTTVSLSVCPSCLWRIVEMHWNKVLKEAREGKDFYAPQVALLPGQIPQYWPVSHQVEDARE